MAVFIGLLGALQMVLGLLAKFSATSAIHETVAAILFGLGTLAIALASILHRLNTPVSQPAPIATNSDLITIYRMYDIRKGAGGVTAAGETFPDVDAAKAFIDKRAKGEA